MFIDEKNLLVKRSLIASAGKGLFTKIPISKGEHIIEYTGVITTWKNVLQSKDFNGYVFYVNRNHVIDAKENLNSLGRYVNDAKGLTKVEGLFNNAKYVENDGKVFLQAIRDIPAGSEILVSYKKGYWDVIRYNAQFNLRKKKRIKEK
ncbi:MAG: SET domain-containing protein-lysine N-methyltransferase [Ginsengibacter sp.]